MENVLLAFMLTLFAGLSTGIGSLLAFFTKRTNTKFLSVTLGFSAGVMLYVSMAEIFFEARKSLIEQLGVTGGSWVTVGSFFAGMLVAALIDKFVPAKDNPHDFTKIGDVCGEPTEDVKNMKLARMGMLTAVTIAIHNFPEGIAAFTATLKDPSLGIAIAVAVAIHNIPEGVAVSVPIYYATGSRKKAFWYSFFSGLAEPLGAVFAYLFLLQFYNELIFGIAFAAVAGIMVFISLDELLPTSREYGEAHLSIYGLIAGMMVMAVSLLLFI